VLIHDLLNLYLRPALHPMVATEVTLAGTLLAAGGVFVLAPLIIRRVWKTQPLPPGPLRDDLEALSTKLKLRNRDFLIWQSDGVLANAGVIGLLPPARYVLLSDALLNRMPRRQVLGIFAHEAAHILHHHMLYAGMFAFATALLVSTVATVWAAYVNVHPWYAELASTLLLIPAWGFGFGWLSRRFERQSDVVAAWVLSKDGLANDASPRAWDDPGITGEGAALFANALEHVAYLNGTSPHQFNWRHGSIAWRVRHILHLAATGQTRQPVDHLVRGIKVSLWLAFLTGLALTVMVEILLERQL